MSENRRHKLVQALEGIQAVLVREYWPERIILFGSPATDTVGEWSDLDLVVIKDDPRPFLERSKALALLCRAHVGVDFLVYTPAEFTAMVAERNPFILAEVLGKGRVLYERQPAESVAGPGS